MRKIPLIAALLAATAAGVQAQTRCRGETISELNACIEAATPEVVAPVEETVVAPVRPATRATLGGPLQPRKLRVEPPLARTPSAGAVTLAPRRLPGGPDATRSPSIYGADGAASRAGRDVLGTPPLGVRGVGDLNDVPGMMGTD